MKTKSSTRPSKKKSARPTTSAVRGRSAKVTAARPKKGASAKKPTVVAKAKSAKPRAAAKSTTGAKYQQSGAPWWKAFL